MAKTKKILLFGNFGTANFGNECTLEAMIYHLRRQIPDAEVCCICSMPEIAAAKYNIAALPICEDIVEPWPWTRRNPFSKWARRLFLSIPCELYRWLKGAITMHDTDMLIVVGTGLMTDAFCLGNWGPYSILKWSVIARLCGCQLAFVSVGVGPLESHIGKLCVKSALSLAQFRSYRDVESLEYLEGIGFRPSGDRIYPDLAFSLPSARSDYDAPKGRRPVVGLGLMWHAAMYGEKPTCTQYAGYLGTMMAFAEWLLDRGFDIRLLIGDVADEPVMRQFESLLKARCVIDQDERIIANSIESFQDLLSELAITDFVVATRFHNVLLSLFLGKPSIAISFHHKCSSLMSQMGLSEYCLDIKSLETADLIQKFSSLESNGDRLRAVIRSRAENCRAALNEQYRFLFKLTAAESQRTRPLLQGLGGA
jgi:polysaccharide pyruvyl transferase WcaK-like protein